ncbi:MAG TPA: energy transducer TonB [Vicinamibacteria bacterium]|nr:energy transducer TonB [Vicinamibacteria bacterium]
MRALLLAGLLLAPLAAAAQPPGDVTDTLASGTPAEQRQALDAVLAAPDAIGSVDLLQAAAVAHLLGRIEDAGFLLYAGQLRARVDLDRFPPRDRGAEGPEALIASLGGPIGEVVNPALMRYPAAFEHAVARLRRWDPVATGDYDPGWDHGASPSADQTRATADRLKREMLQPVEGMARLLANPEYFEAFKTVQDASRDTSDDVKKPERVAAAQAAERTMAEIEKRMGIAGLYTRAVAPRAAPRTPRAVTTTEPRRVGGPIAQPRRLRFVQPRVPSNLPADVPRTVVLELTVDERGRVVEATVLRGHPAVDKPIAEALRQWVYAPTLENGIPIPVTFPVTVKRR